MNCSFDNTYKMAWAKALVELSLFYDNNDSNNDIGIEFQEIAKLCLKYYWNQTIYFDLVQGSNLIKIPEILRYTKHLIDQYFSSVGSQLPERFEKIDFDKIGLSNQFENTISKITSTLKKDVCYRFLRLNGQEELLYNLDIKNGKVFFNSNQVRVLTEYSELLFEIINYRWTQILESFNHSPKISMKVRVISEGTIRRNNLSPFKEYLDLENADGKRYCFYCNQEISKDEESIDHVIPWSFMFSDDIWNLVYCHRSENSSKSNLIPNEKIIEKLETRNSILEKRIDEYLKKGKKVDELKLAIEKDYVRKFWMAAKG